MLQLSSSTSLQHNFAEVDLFFLEHAHIHTFTHLESFTHTRCCTTLLSMWWQTLTKLIQISILLYQSCRNKCMVYGAHEKLYYFLHCQQLNICAIDKNLLDEFRNTQNNPSLQYLHILPFKDSTQNESDTKEYFFIFLSCPININQILGSSYNQNYCFT